MFRGRFLAGLTMMALAACQQGPHPVTAAKPTATPGAKASAPLAQRTLQKPPGNPRVLEGTVRLDAGYMASVSTGRSLDGAYAVADAQLVANNGSNIISDNGAGILSNNGGGILSNNSGSLTSKVKRALLAAAAPALGQRLPIAGMAIAAVDLASRQPISVGVDPDGKPVYVIHTDAQGHYKLYLPEGQARNVRVVAAVPDATDPRLTYGLVANPAAEGTKDFTEEAALASDYLRFATYQLFITSLGQGDSASSVDQGLAGIPAGLQAVLRAGLAPYLEVLGKVDRTKVSKARERRAVRNFADALIARVDLSKLRTDGILANSDAPPGPAMPFLEASFKEIDEAAAVRMAQDPHYFDNKPYVTEANLTRAGLELPPVAIKRPSDVGRFTNEEYEGSPQAGRIHSAWTVLVDLGLSAAKEEALNDAYQAITLGMLQQIFTVEGVQDELVKTFAAEFDAEAQPGLRPEPEPVTPAVAPFQIPGEPAVSVSTLAGSGTPGTTDGPAASAGIGSVLAMAVDGGKLYFTQQGGALRVVDLAAPGQPVSTVPVDLQAPYGVVPAGDGTLYVADTGRQKLYQLALPDQLTEIASPGQTAITSYYGLALDGKGGLIVTDWIGQRVGRVDLGAPNHPITQLVGGARPDGLTPSAGGGALDQPLGVVVTADGTVVVTENFSSRLWTVPAGGPPQLLAGWSQSALFGDGFYLGAGFCQPAGLALDRDGSVLVADTNAERVRRVRFQAGGGVVTTLAGSGPGDTPAFADGAGTTARFAAPTALAVGADGTIYVGENGRIRTIKR